MKIAIFGSGGFGREVRQLIDDLSAANQDAGLPGIELLGFLDDDTAKHGSRVADLPVIGDSVWVEMHREVGIVVAVGAPGPRRAIATRLRGLGATFPALVHPTATVGRSVAIGAGSIICAHAVLTTDIRVGEFVVIDVASTVAHDDRLDDFATLHPRSCLCGNVHLEEGVKFGAGSVAIPGVTIGAWTILGAGASVTKDLPAHVTAVGVPARVIKRHLAD